jgi:hypothetical protein
MERGHNHVKFTTDGRAQEKQIRQWVRFELAARKIQRAWRSWQRLLKLRALLKSRRGPVRLVTPASESLSACFKNIVQGRASFDDKMTLWRAVAELRRSHSSPCTDLILRALIEAKGEHARASCLLGMKEFCESSKAVLSPKLKDLFLPSFEKRDVHEVLG